MRHSAFEDALLAACPATCPRLPHEAEISVRHRFVEANGVRFHVVEAGGTSRDERGTTAGSGGDGGTADDAGRDRTDLAADGAGQDGEDRATRGSEGNGDGTDRSPGRPLVLLLHGFPEFWYGWRSQIAALAERFWVVAPDLRGYNLSAKPAAGYDYETLSRDVPALIRALGAERAHVVGHDWGGMVAWGTAIFHPEVVDRLAILNAPHPAAYLRELGRNPIQQLRSWYIALFQVRGLAEWLLTRGHGQGVADMLRGSTLDHDTFSEADLAAYRRAVSRPGAAQAMLTYYRALWSTDQVALRSRLGVVRASTLLIWGIEDVALVPELTDDLDDWVPDVHVERIANASHWVQHERPSLVNRLLLEHLGAGS